MLNQYLACAIFFLNKILSYAMELENFSLCDKFYYSLSYRCICKVNYVSDAIQFFKDFYAILEHIV